MSDSKQQEGGSAATAPSTGGAPSNAPAATSAEKIVESVSSEQGNSIASKSVEPSTGSTEEPASNAGVPASQQHPNQQPHGYNNNYNANNAGGKGFNKQYNGRHNNNNNYGNNNNNTTGGNRQNYNRKSGYNNQKVNHNANQQYGYPQPYAQNMYSYGYYGNPYGYMVPAPGPYNQAQAALQNPQAQVQTPFSPVAGNKVKITDREGKEIDLEDKKKLSSSSTPISSPANTIASPATSTPPATATISAPAAVASATPAAVSNTQATNASAPAVTEASSSTPAAVAPAATGKLSIAEEFKRKILEKAAKAAQKKPEVKEEPKEVKTEASKEVAQEEPTPVPAPAQAPAPKVEEPKEEVKAVEEPTPKVEEEPTEVATETEKESTDAPVSENVVEEEPSKVAATEESTVDAEAQPEAKDVENPEQSAPEQTEQTEQGETKEVEGEESTQGEEPVEEEPSFTLSNFFERVSNATPLEDPLSVSYPEPLQAPDAKWKHDQIKYRYDPVFLMQFRDVCQVAVDLEWKTKLESLGITGNKRQGSSQSSRGGMGKFGNNNSMGGRFNSGPLARGQFNDGRQNSRNGSKRRGGSSGGPRDKSTRKNQSKRGGRERESKSDEPSKPLEDVKPLVVSENRWVPRSRATKTEVKTAPDGSELLETEDIERKVKSLLNKLTLEMFEQITDDIMKIANQSKWEEDAKTVRQIISLTFAKACDEPYWSSMYAQFCAKMCKEMTDEIKDVNIIVKGGEIAKGGDLARRILLATCQVEYEKGWTDKLPTNEDGSPLEPEMMSDEYYIMAAAKRRGLGLVKFIGHLYILNMLNDQVILLCLRDQSGNTDDPSEDRLENLTQLIKTVGARLETKDKTKAALNFVFDNVQTILDNCKLASRIKFMLMDLIDLRNSNWVSAKNEAVPKTIQEIHDEAEIKKFEDEKAAAERRRKNKMSDSRSNSSRAGSNWGSLNLKKDMRAPQKDSRGFTSVQSSRSQSNRPNIVESSMSPRDNSKRADSIQSAANMFAALGDEEDHEDEASEEQETPAEVAPEVEN